MSYALGCVHRSLAAGIVGALALFCGAMIACARAGWHRPEDLALAFLASLAVALGVILAAAGVKNGPARRSVHPAALLAATLGGVATIAGSSVAVALAIDRLPLVLASTVGSAWIALYPLHVVLWHALFVSRVEVGVDELRVGRRRYPLRSLRRVRASGTRVDVEADVDEVALRMPSAKAALELELELGERLAAEVPALPGREGRTLDAWRRALTGAGYREARVRVEDAASVIVAARATPEARVAAALVLAESGARDKIRIAAQRCIDPDVRALLERAASDELDEAALRRLAK